MLTYKQLFYTTAILFCQKNAALNEYWISSELSKKQTGSFW